MADQLRPMTAPAPLASSARTSPGGMQCPLCSWPIDRGQREAKLPDGRWCHVACVIKGTA